MACIETLAFRNLAFVYRGEENWLDRTLSSVATGARPGIEVIVLDSSPDQKSMAIVRRYEKLLELRIVNPGEVDGCSPKMNLGVEAASAELRYRGFVRTIFGFRTGWRLREIGLQAIRVRFFIWRPARL